MLKGVENRGPLRKGRMMSFFSSLTMSGKTYYEGEDRDTGLAMVLVEDGSHTTMTNADPDIEEILALSLEGVDLIEENGIGSSIWVLENIQEIQ